jgi:methylenetetrahydrofolate dehydrogenase (NADP+)/methenyltetrahydrofolate cyclohydrolase
MVQIIDGKIYSDELCRQLKDKIHVLAQKYHLTPGLAPILVGEDEASKVYVASKIRRALDVGINIFDCYFDAQIREIDLINKIRELNSQAEVNGILVQLPLPSTMSENKVINSIDYEKDVDGFTIQNIGLLNSWQDCLEPSTPQGALLLIKSVLGQDLSGKKAVVLGRSIIVGRPMASILIRESCTVSLLHSKSQRIEEECRNADIIISAIGKPHFIKADLVKPGACVIDIGITRVAGKLYGDVDFEDVSKVAGSITPVPGGVGPMTVACMLSNTVKALCNQRGIDFDKISN